MENSPPTKTPATAQGTHEQSDWGSSGMLAEAE